MRLGDCCKTNLHTYSDKEKWSLIRYLDTGSITEGRIDEIQTLYPGVEKTPAGRDGRLLLETSFSP